MKSEFQIKFKQSKDKKQREQVSKLEEKPIEIDIFDCENDEIEKEKNELKEAKIFEKNWRKQKKKKTFGWNKRQKKQEWREKKEFWRRLTKLKNKFGKLNNIKYFPYVKYFCLSVHNTISLTRHEQVRSTCFPYQQLSSDPS